MLGDVALVAVLAGLALTVRAQVRPLRQHRRLLDLLALVPEWRFFAHTGVRSATDLATDIHLVVRDRAGAGVVGAGMTGAWRPVLWPVERRLHHLLWNPGKRVIQGVLTIAEIAADAWRRTPPQDVQQTIPYLILLRRCLAAPADRPGMVERQFAIVRTSGRADRSLSVEFVSAWHRP